VAGAELDAGRLAVVLPRIAGGRAVASHSYWVAAFERPVVPLLFGEFTGMLMDEEYTSRYGFLPNPKESYDADGMTLNPADLPGLSTIRQDERNNPSHFPVGLVRTRDFTDRAINRTSDMLGLTCAACHTGQINFEGIGYRIDGGPAMTDLGKFRSAVSKSMGLTYFSGLVSFLPFFNGRWNRFADRVLGEDRTSAQTADLKEWMRSLVSRGKATAEVERERKIYELEEGFSRLDAIERIGNFVFAVELDSVVNSVNWSQASAPVNFPHIWDSPWFEWVQYNASFKQPMMRNVGEAMGVYADVDLQSIDDPQLLFKSTVDIVRVHEMETLIAGKTPYQGLRSPPWPFGTPNPDLVARGDSLYRANCQGCHLPPMSDELFWADSLWTPVSEHGQRYLKLNLVNLWDIGTDPLTAENFYKRLVQMGRLGEKFNDEEILGGRDVGGMTTAAAALPFLIRMTAERRMDDVGIPDSLKEMFWGYRPDNIQAPMAYKARPLNGVWATPPFFHDSSGPNIYLLLSPPAERPDTFWLGTKDYDPTHLGLVYSEIEGGFLFDTTLPGNSNQGHEFAGSSDPEHRDYWWNGSKGRIGPELVPDDRLAIMEFLKTLPGEPVRRPGN
jgi:hypothetical protein